MHMEVSSQFNHPGGQVGATVVAGLAVEEAKKGRKERDIEVHIIGAFNTKTLKLINTGHRSKD